MLINVNSTITEALEIHLTKEYHKSKLEELIR